MDIYLSQLPASVKLNILSGIECEESIASQTGHQLLTGEYKQDEPVLTPFQLEIRKPTSWDPRILPQSGFDSLLEEGYFIMDNVLSEKKSSELEDSLKTMESNGDFLKPRLANSSLQETQVPLIRGDSICWRKLSSVDESSPLSFIQEIIHRLSDDLRSWKFNLKRIESQIARYPGDGSGYYRHLDGYAGGPSRQLTCIYYCNGKWKESDGGKLVLYIPSKSEGKERVVKVPPLGGRMVFFLSQYIPHEVEPSFSPRFAITSWFH